MIYPKFLFLWNALNKTIEQTKNCTDLKEAEILLTGMNPDFVELVIKNLDNSPPMIQHLIGAVENRFWSFDCFTDINDNFVEFEMRLINSDNFIFHTCKISLECFNIFLTKYLSFYDPNILYTGVYYKKEVEDV